jgi:hypothetical protein
MAIKEAFPVLFDIACAKDAFVAAHMELDGGYVQWNLNFVRVVDWEVDVFCLVLQGIVFNESETR